MPTEDDEVLAATLVQVRPTGVVVPVVVLEFFPEAALGLPPEQAGVKFRRFLARGGWLPADGFFDDAEWFSATTLVLRIDPKPTPAGERLMTIENDQGAIYIGPVLISNVWLAVARQYGDIPVLAGANLGPPGTFTLDNLRDCASRGLLMIAAAAATIPG